MQLMLTSVSQYLAQMEASFWSSADEDEAISSSYQDNNTEEEATK